MKKIKHKNILFLGVVFLCMSLFFYVLISREKNENKKENISDNNKEISMESDIGIEDEEKNNIQEVKGILIGPMDRVSDRVNKKPFGIFVSPQKSPVNPERFSGYHTAIDLEIFPDELGMEMKVRAACGGEIISKKSADGYGGLLIQSCEIESESVTVVYGHLKLSSIEKDIGERLDQGEEIGLLGDGYSSETDGERKHLHFGIHKGKEINTLGYTANKNALSEWIDPCTYLCNK